MKVIKDWLRPRNCCERKFGSLELIDKRKRQWTVVSHVKQMVATVDPTHYRCLHFLQSHGTRYTLIFVVLFQLVSSDWCLFSISRSWCRSIYLCSRYHFQIRSHLGYSWYSYCFVVIMVHPSRVMKLKSTWNIGGSSTRELHHYGHKQTLKLKDLWNP